MLIRAETEDDREPVYRVNLSAFETSFEADLVDVLREQAQCCVSLVAEHDGQVVGHIMFSPVSLAGHPGLKMMGLAPMAVAPDYRNQGLGSKLVRKGLDQCNQLEYSAIVVLGHASYYPRFGFSPASRFDIDSEYEVADEAFMALELKPGALGGKSGRVKYHAAFGANSGD